MCNPRGHRVKLIVMNHHAARMEDARLLAFFGEVIAQQCVQVGVHGCGNSNAPVTSDASGGDYNMRSLSGHPGGVWKMDSRFRGNDDLGALMLNVCHPRESGDP